MDKGEIVCLLLLDLSATFDTIDKTVLLNRVKYRFGYGRKVLDWIGSLFDRKISEGGHK